MSAALRTPPRAHRPARCGERAQGIVETGLITMVLVILVVGIVGGVAVVDARTQVRSATVVATSSAFSVPAGNAGAAMAAVRDSFRRSVHSPYLVPQSLSISCPASWGNEYLYSSAYRPRTVVACQGRGTISFRNSVLAMVWRWDLTVTQEAREPAPDYRQCAAGVAC